MHKQKKSSKAAPTSQDHLTSRRSVIRNVISGISSIKVAQTLTTFTGLSALGMTTTGCMGETTYDLGELDAYEPFWTYRANRLEEYQAATFGGVRSKEDPKEHKIAVHDPAVSVQGGILRATVDHVMELDHWITTIYVRDIDTGRVFYLKEFHPTELAPMTEKGASIEVQIPEGVLRIGVFSFCNKHELWWSGIIDLG